MTAKEYFKKEYGEDHLHIVIELNDIVSLFLLMEEYANQKTRHIAKQAVRDSTESKIDEGFEHGRGHFSACLDILTRIKELTQGES